MHRKPGAAEESRARWQACVKGLDPQSCCEMLGIQHFPHYLAAAANFYLLARHLGARHDGKMSVRQAIVAELMAGPHPPSCSEDAPYWQAIKPHLPEVEAMAHAFMMARNALQD